jgi:tetratricopeptide (TPR) repeat protein
MKLGRARRMLADFDAARRAYAEAGKIATRAGDENSVLLSRIGQCNVLYFEGNLSEAERGWRGVLSDASSGSFREVEAQAEHGLGTLLGRRGQPHEGAPHLWRAYELYDDESAQLRALGDLAMCMLTLGDVESAEQALQHVARRCPAGEVQTNAMIELMHCASYRRDRVGFERWREQGAAQIDTMIPNVRADYYLKVGMGLARFDSYAKAESNLRRAHEIATAHGLHELVFRIERVSNGLRDCETLDEFESSRAEPVVTNDALRDVCASLAALGA